MHTHVSVKATATSCNVAMAAYLVTDAFSAFVKLCMLALHSLVAVDCGSYERTATVTLPRQLFMVGMTLMVKEVRLEDPKQAS